MPLSQFIQAKTEKKQAAAMQKIEDMQLHYNMQERQEHRIQEKENDA
jgi:hypothetical protein